MFDGWSDGWSDGWLVPGKDRDPKLTSQINHEFQSRS